MERRLPPIEDHGDEVGRREDASVVPRLSDHLIHSGGDRTASVGHVGPGVGHVPAGISRIAPTVRRITVSVDRRIPYRHVEPAVVTAVLVVGVAAATRQRSQQRGQCDRSRYLSRRLHPVALRPYPYTRRAPLTTRSGRNGRATAVGGDFVDPGYQYILTLPATVPSAFPIAKSAMPSPSRSGMRRPWFSPVVVHPLGVASKTAPALFASTGAEAPLNVSPSTMANELPSRDAMTRSGVESPISENDWSRPETPPPMMAWPQRPALPPTC